MNLGGEASRHRRRNSGHSSVLVIGLGQTEIVGSRQFVIEISLSSRFFLLSCPATDLSMMILAASDAFHHQFDDLDLKKRRESEIICCGVLGFEFFVLSEHKRL